MIVVEREIIRYVEENITLANSFGIQPPFYVFISITGVKGCTICRPNCIISIGAEDIQNEDIYLPEVIINTFNDDIAKALKPVFDMIWNAAGLSRSYGYNENGDLDK